MEQTHWTEIFGNEATALQIMIEAENSQISIADYLETAYIEMFTNNPGEMADNIDFGKWADQLHTEALQDDKYLQTHLTHLDDLDDLNN